MFPVWPCRTKIGNYLREDFDFILNIVKERRMKAKSIIIKFRSVKEAANQAIKNICRANRKLYSTEEKIRIAIKSLSRETSITGLCRRAGIAQSMYYK